MGRRNVLLAAASGILLTASFPDFNIFPLAWIAIVPLLLSLNGQTFRNGLYLGGIFGIVFFAGTVHWVTNSVHFYGNVPLIPASFITLLLCAYLALYPALFGATVVRLKQSRPRLFIFSAPAVWTALELGRTYIISGFPWALLGYTQYKALPVIQISDITGVYGVSFLIVLVNAALAEFILDRKRYKALVAASLAVVMVTAYGLVRLEQHQDAGAVKISLIQGNIEQDKKWDPAYQAAVFSTYKRLTLEAIKEKPDVIIWPETATPFYFGGLGKSDRAQTEDLTRFIKQNKVPILFGSPTYELRPGRTVILKNSAFLVSADGAKESAYHKLHLVPFGEYVPLKGLLFFIEKMVQAIGDFQSGSEYTVMIVRAERPDKPSDVKFSTVICYEIIFPDLVRRFVDEGAAILTTITNDAWFGRTAAPMQHFSMAVFRAVENRVPVARAANTGISGFIDSRGRIIAASEIFVEAKMTGMLVPRRMKTLYTRWGDAFAYACTIASLVMIIISRRNRKGMEFHR